MSENEQREYPPTVSAATAAERNATVTGFRLVKTVYGEKPVMTCEDTDGTQYQAWSSPYQAKQLTGSDLTVPKVALPARVMAFESKFGRTGYKLVPKA